MAEPHPETGRSLPITWTIPPGLVSCYATNFVIQRTELEVTLSFFEVQTPIILGSEEQRAEALAKLESVPAICVARVVITPSRLPEILKVLKDHMEQYEQGQKPKPAE